MILIDTDVAIDLLRGLPQALDWFDELSTGEVVVLSGYSVIELIKGSRDSTSLQRIRRWLKNFGVLWLSPEGCTQALELFATFKLSHNLGSYDSMIGQTAVEREVILYTFNAKHLSLIPGIQIAQPYVRS
jgi:predicted nucleic acid-binding protein